MKDYRNASEEYARGHKVGCEMAVTYLTSDENRARKREKNMVEKWSVRCGYLRDMMKAVCPTSKPRSFTSTAVQTEQPSNRSSTVYSGLHNKHPLSSCLDASIHNHQHGTTSIFESDIKCSTSQLGRRLQQIAPITPLPPLLHQPRDLSRFTFTIFIFSIFISSTSF